MDADLWARSSELNKEWICQEVSRPTGAVTSAVTNVPLEDSMNVVEPGRVTVSRLSLCK